jgi:hypothetical protein
MNSAVKKPLYQPSWRQQQQNQGSTRQPTLKDLVKQQIRINSEINEKLAANDRILEDINIKMDSFSSTINDRHKREPPLPPPLKRRRGGGERRRS